MYAPNTNTHTDVNTIAVELWTSLWECIFIYLYTIYNNWIKEHWKMHFYCIFSAHRMERSIGIERFSHVRISIQTLSFWKHSNIWLITILWNATNMRENCAVLYGNCTRKREIGHPKLLLYSKYVHSWQLHRMSCFEDDMNFHGM